MLTLFTIPSATSSIADISSYSTTYGTEFLIVAFVIVGVLVAGMFASKMIKVVLAGAGKVLGGSKRGGRRMRR